MMRIGTAWMIVLAACTVDNSNDDPFGAATIPAPSTTITTAPETSGDETSSGSSSDGGQGDTTTGTTTTASPESTGPDPAGTSDGGSSDGGGGNGMQPADGLYSPCLVANDCGFSPNLCITIQDAMMMDIDGFCSVTGCSNPAADCDPSPGGTAIPRCMPVTVNNMALQACALDCSAGKVCPAPMQCYDLMGVGMICA